MHTTAKGAQAHAAWANPFWLAFGLAVGLVGCGGGGGDDAPAPSTGAQPLALTPQTMGDVGASALAGGEAVLQIGQLAVDLTNRFVAASSAAAINESCPNGGTLALTLVDRDANGKPSTGDRVTAQLRDCAVPLVGNVLNGTIGFEIAAATGGATTSLRGTLDFVDGVEIVAFSGAIPGVTVRLLGTLAVEGSRASARTRVAVASTSADNLRLSGTDGTRTITDAYRAIAASKLIAYDDARITVEMAYQLDSESLGGRLAVSTPQPLLAHLNTFPEEGRVEVRGAGATVLALTPNFVSASDRFDLSLDLGGNGTSDNAGSLAWTDAVQGYPWWDGQAPLGWSDNPYATQAFSSSAFSVATSIPPMPSGDAPVRFQFSRVPVDLVTPRFRFRDNGSTSGYEPVQLDVSATATREGALIQVRPDQPLRHARFYVLDVSTDGGASWASASVTAHDALGNAATLYAYSSFVTPDTMRAVAAAGVTMLVDAPSSTQLSAADSISARPIASYRWTQVSGPPLTLGTPDAATTSASLAAPVASALDKAVIELRITDTAGEVEAGRITINLLNTHAPGKLLYFRSSPGDYIGQGQIFVGSDTTGTFNVGNAYAGIVTFDYSSSSFNESWTLWLARADSGPLSAGAYENAVRAAFHDNQNGLDLFGMGRGCNMVAGRFDVLEVQLDGAGKPTKLAVDFEQHCESIQAPPLFGSLRINSSIPLRP